MMASFLNDQRSGHGLLILVNGDRYDGEFRDDKKNGPGVYTWPDGRRYDGEWRDDEKATAPVINFSVPSETGLRRFYNRY